MSMLRHRLGILRRNDSAGYTLVEMLVALTIFSVLGAIVLSTIVAARSTTDATRLTSDLNEEARVALNRISRELRQAVALIDVKGAGGVAVTAAAPAAAHSFTFQADFDGDGVIEATAVDPEELTYSWNGSQLLLTAADISGSVVTSPVLAGHVTAFAIEFRSSLWQYDCDGVNGTLWTELDKYQSSGGCAPPSATVGDNSGTLTAPELAHVDNVVINLTVLQGSKRQDYRIQVDVRNAQ
jgi:prepilin-type N-terminal cleavage/methylation domain-containing protein